MSQSDDRPTVASAPPPPSAAAVIRLSSFVENPGDTIGPYRLLSLLGEGGFGTVWLAERREPFIQRVAVKIIKPGMDSRAVIARFEQERQALAVMDHPNVARVLDAGATSSGRPYFVMEYVAGEPITDYCDKHRLTIRRRLDLFIHVCDAVQHAHHKGIIHRDLKPGNILVAEHDGIPLAKVIDFGVAKAVSHTLTDKTIFTETGQIIGTPEYMSPEQANLGAADIDTRTDVYALGAVLYELLTGGVPFASETLRAGGYGEIQRIIREVDPPKPSTRLVSLAADKCTVITQQRQVDRAALTTELRNELDWIPLKALRKDRKDRYSSPADLARDIRNYLDGRPLEAGPESAVYRFRKAVRRNRALFAGVTAVAAALVLGLIAFAFQSYRVGVQRDAAIAARNDAIKAQSLAEQERKRAEAIADFIHTALKSGDPNQGGRRDMQIGEVVQNAVRDINSGAFKDQPATESELLLTLADILNGNAHSAEALPLAQRGLEIAKSLHPAPNSDHDDIARALAVIGACNHTLGHDEESLTNFQSALDITQRLHPGDNSETARILGEIALVLDALGRAPEGLPKYEASLAMSRRLFSGDNPTVAMALGNLAFCYQKNGRPADALPNFQAALEMEERLHPGDNSDRARAMNNVGFCYHALGRFEDALTIHQAALDMRKRIFKADNPSIARSTSNVATALQSLGRSAEALTLFQDCLTLNRRLYTGDHPDTANSLGHIAVCYTTMQRHADALPYYEQTLDMLKRLRTGDHPDVAEAMNNAGRANYLVGRSAESEPLLRDALAMYKRVRPGDNANTANCTANLAATLGALDKLPEALDLAQQAVTMAAKVLPDGAPIRKKCDNILSVVKKRSEGKD